MKVLGVSGSPIKDSNADRALKAALEATGMDYEFVKLIDYTVAPCKACLGCVKTNVCVIKDDGIALAEKAKEADALIIAGFTPYSTLDSRTKAFIERLYPLRHRYGFMRGKPGGAIVTSAIPKGMEMMPPAGDNGINAISYYMMEEGMESVGSVIVLGNNPCVRCIFGDECDMSGIKMMFGPDATKASVGINRFEDQPEAVEAAKELGKNIAEHLKSKE
ncbi:flavodoxin family protein [Methanococcoides alaskense]|uniref:Multimeric flavodoxin WrbA n=1 Tax=Methanococcoides alaskense TaxID=325778 RepID=A0AA90Z631_9EURY|nr:flavodoxin family protein [Methanococcoides alaskense]MDA0525365.1 flavodoxin family protein [Methanococcoides alaskense]MDR6221704.1 multimeric flavodoxin WrbA [Methanococcoides alaskense]